MFIFALLNIFISCYILSGGKHYPMKLILQIKRILLSTALAISIMAPGLTSAPATASSMAQMGHPPTDIVACLNQHQAPTAPTSGESRHLKDDDKERHIPPVNPYFVAFQHTYNEPQKSYRDPSLTSSFRPPDIVILTARLRI